MLHVTKRVSRGLNRADFRKTQSSFTVYSAMQPLRNASPQIYGNAVAGAENVVGTGRQIHRQLVQVAGSVLKNLCTESLETNRTLRVLLVKIVQRGDIGIGIGTMQQHRMVAGTPRRPLEFRRWRKAGLHARLSLG